MKASLIQNWAQERGYRFACGSVRALLQARATIRQQHDSAELDEGLYREGMHRFVEEVAAPSGGRLVIVAVPRPAHRVDFDLETGPIDALLPPTYVDYLRTGTRVRDDLAENVLVGDRVEALVAPLKAVATRLGLVRYGRNNITYAEKIGSYLQLCGYLTDAAVDRLPIADEAEPRLLDQCADCDRCITTCPTGAIGRDRILVRAHRCLTRANENPGEWPKWVPRHSHHCLIGCLACQRPCPANPPLQVVDTDVRFSLEETRALLTDLDDASGLIRQGIQQKMEQLGQETFTPLLGRNLSALISKRAGKRTER